MHAAFIVEFFHKCEEGFNQGLLAQSVYYTHMHVHCRYPDVHVLSENNSMCLAMVPQQWAFPSHVGKGDMAIKQCTIQADSSMWLCYH